MKKSSSLNGRKAQCHNHRRCQGWFHLRAVIAAVILGLASGASAATRYVWTGSPSPGSDYLDWATAAHTIQDAVDAASAGDTVLVTNGTYAVGGALTPGFALTNRICITNAITVQSVNGAEVTTIMGSGPNGDTAVRCVYLGTNAVLSGFTLTGGATRRDGDADAEQSGGGVWCAAGAVVSNCAITGNTAASSGGGSSHGTLNNCCLSGNQTDGNGGGADDGVLDNCTLTGNSAANAGGGSYDGTLRNCIVCYNQASFETNYDGSMFFYSCTTPDPGGVGNIAAEPELASASHLAVGSPCIGTGSSAFATGVDIDGEVWINPPSMGCDEVVSGSITGALNVTAEAAYTNVAVGFPVSFTARISGRTTASRWDFQDGTIVSNRPYATHVFPTNGLYAVELTAFNETHPAGVSTTVTVHVTARGIHYVNQVNATPVAPYNTWPTAATNIQDAVDAATVPGDLVLVTNGTYDTGSRVVFGSMDNRVVVTNAITVESATGPEQTIIRGAWNPITTNGDAAVRCVYLGAGAVISGFTLTQGATRTNGDAFQEQSGGGVWCETGAIVTNCLLLGNAAYYDGGGSFRGELDDCTLEDNASSANAGGAYSGRLNHCTLTGNTAEAGGGGSVGGRLNYCTLTNNRSSYYGGGSSGGKLDSCTLTGNSATDYGGGTYYGVLTHCTLSSNSAGYYGGGAYAGAFDNCSFLGNSAAYGGGAYYSALMRCTLADNSATYGGGSYRGTLTNCIIYFNSASLGVNYYEGDVNFSCTTPDPGGTGNITDDPQFLDAVAGDFHLQATSPCIDAGINVPGAAQDLDGTPRPLDGDANGTAIMDMGCYEYLNAIADSSSDGIPDGWAWSHGLNPVLDNATNDADGDGVNNLPEYIADTNPTNAASYFHITGISNIPPVEIWFQSSANRLYALVSASNLVNAVWVNVPGEGPRAGVSGLDHLTDANATPRQFYRVRVQVP